MLLIVILCITQYYLKYRELNIKNIDISATKVERMLQRFQVGMSKLHVEECCTMHICTVGYICFYLLSMKPVKYVYTFIRHYLRY